MGRADLKGLARAQTRWCSPVTILHPLVLMVNEPILVELVVYPSPEPLSDWTSQVVHHVTHSAHLLRERMATAFTPPRMAAALRAFTHPAPLPGRRPGNGLTSPLSVHIRTNYPLCGGDNTTT